jgi:hypothetical protein
MEVRRVKYVYFLAHILHQGISNAICKMKIRTTRFRACSKFRASLFIFKKSLDSYEIKESLKIFFIKLILNNKIQGVFV